MPIHSHHNPGNKIKNKRLGPLNFGGKTPRPKDLPPGLTTCEVSTTSQLCLSVDQTFRHGPLETFSIKTITPGTTGCGTQADHGFSLESTHQAGSAGSRPSSSTRGINRQQHCDDALITFLALTTMEARPGAEVDAFLVEWLHPVL